MKPAPEVISGIDGLRKRVGQAFGPAGSVLIDQDLIDRFASVTRDEQWIHVDPARAANGPFGTTVAHGYLTLSLVSHLLASVVQVQGVSMIVNYGLNRVRFPAPVPAGSAVQATATLDTVTDLPGGVEAQWTVTVSVVDAAKPACVAEAVGRYYG